MSQDSTAKAVVMNVPMEKKPFTRQQRLEAAKGAMQGLLAYHGLSKDIDYIMTKSVELGDRLLTKIEEGA